MSYCFHCFSSDIIILAILWVRTKNSERMKESYNTLRNDAPDTFRHCSMWVNFRDQNKLMMQENGAYGEN